MSFPQFIFFLFLATVVFSFDCNLDRRSVAGLWRLTTGPSFPLKEFTVYPKQQQQQEQQEDELLLMLKEDGSFQQYNNNDKDIDHAWSRFQRQQDEKELYQQFLQGTWDFRDGKLILAADRPTNVRRDAKSKTPQKPSDTLLTGRVVARYQNKLRDNPQLLLRNQENTNSNDKKSTSVHLDAYLSVPKGSVQVGRFFYPKNHPSFFDQPMFQPKKRGTVTLRQILGTLNTANDDDDDENMVEKFRNRDFYNKTFLLTSHPIGFKKAAAEKEEQQRPENIRVMQIMFHANNTFSTVAGLGENILRGKFSIMGNARDQLWMQVSRFGFGRSVSGSVYSEGNSISHEDAKSYWGTIGFQEDLKNGTNATADSEPARPIEVKGSVLFGWGIEPIPEARFIMRELASEESIEDEEEDEDDEDDDDMFQLDADLTILGEEDGIDLTDSESFQ